MSAPTCLYLVRRTEIFVNKAQICRHYKSSSRCRVVVTGMGLVSCLGIGLDHVWQRLLHGQCGIQRLTHQEYETIPCKVAGLVPRGNAPGHLNLDDHFPASELRHLPDSVAFAHIAAQEALTLANWKADTEEQKCYSGVAVGMGLSNLEYIATAGQTMAGPGYKRISPYFIPNILINAPAGAISLKHQFKGPNHTVSTACSTGLVAIGDAYKFIQRGIANVMIAGSTEACIGPLSIAGFSRLRALSTKFNDIPGKSSRPFDKDRDGFVMSEGAGMMVLEEHEHAKQRGAVIYGEILGYGIVGDAHHMTSPRDDGEGGYRSMQAALHDAGIGPDSVHYINAHATSTPQGDIAEARSIERLFSTSVEDLLVSSTKGAIGHLQGAAGSVEAILALMACYSGKVPPTLNLENIDDKCPKLNYIPNTSQNWPDNGKRRISLTNSFGFWGTNGTLCLGQMIP